MAGFLVVKFIDENSVTVVPSSWVKEEEDAAFCAWPPYKSLNRLDIAVRNKEYPKPSWQWIKVDVMKNADTYEKGLKYEERAMYTSDMATESEEMELNKNPKKRKRTSRYEDYSSDDENTETKLPPFPRMQRSPLCVVPASNCPPQPVLKNPLHYCSSSSPDTVPIHIPDHTFVKENKINESNREESFQKKVLRMLEGLRQDVKELKAALKTTKNPLPQLPPGCPKLPCENPEDLVELNILLQDEAVFASVCDYLSTIGGSCVKDSTRRVLQQLISNNLSMKYNWKGTRGVKLGFAIFTTIIKLILGAVRNNKAFSSATEVEVHNIIKKWLMHAKDREGGRNTRTERASLNNTSTLAEI